jgi:hypothetical protein
VQFPATSASATGPCMSKSPQPRVASLFTALHSLTFPLFFPTQTTVISLASFSPKRTSWHRLSLGVYLHGSALRFLFTLCSKLAKLNSVSYVNISNSFHLGGTNRVDPRVVHQGRLG